MTVAQAKASDLRMVMVGNSGMEFWKISTTFYNYGEMPFEICSGGGGDAQASLSLTLSVEKMNFQCRGRHSVMLLHLLRRLVFVRAVTAKMA